MVQFGIESGAPSHPASWPAAERPNVRQRKTLTSPKLKRPPRLDDALLEAIYEQPMGTELSIQSTVLQETCALDVRVIEQAERFRPTANGQPFSVRRSTCTLSGILVLTMRILPIVLAVPLLCAASNEQPENTVELPARDRERALETYVEELGSLVEAQARDLARLTPPDEVAKLEEEHDAWILDRDLQCAQQEEGENFRIRELECLANLSELYFERLQIKIDRLDKKFAVRRPFILKSPGDISELPGIYYRGDGKGFNLHLDLKQDQTYSAVLDGCLGEYGRSFGTWSLDDGYIFFRPTEESEDMKRHLTKLAVGYQDEILFLFPDPNDDSFRKYGPSRSSVFSRRVEMTPE